MDNLAEEAKDAGHLDEHHNEDPLTCSQLNVDIGLLQAQLENLELPQQPSS